jgi:hypothetical protein
MREPAISGIRMRHYDYYEIHRHVCSLPTVYPMLVGCVRKPMIRAIYCICMSGFDLDPDVSLWKRDSGVISEHVCSWARFGEVISRSSNNCVQVGDSISAFAPVDVKLRLRCAGRSIGQCHSLNIQRGYVEQFG